MIINLTQNQKALLNSTLVKEDSSKTCTDIMSKLKNNLCNIKKIEEDFLLNLGLCIVKYDKYLENGKNINRILLYSAKGATFIK